MYSITNDEVYDVIDRLTPELVTKLKQRIIEQIA